MGNNGSPITSGCTIHVGNDYIAVGYSEGKNLYESVLQIGKIVMTQIREKGQGEDKRKTPW